MSLYKGKLHQLSEDAPPRQWTIPKPKISRKHFQSLLLNRSKAHERLQPETNNAADDDVDMDNEEAVSLQETNVMTATSDKEKRKAEIKEQLEILNQRKHGLVQVLKQIANAEEQIKKQNSNQGNSGRPPLPPQVEKTGTDSVSMTRINTPGENPFSQKAVNGSSPESQSRDLPRMNSPSPLPYSQQLNPGPNNDMILNAEGPTKKQDSNPPLPPRVQTTGTNSGSKSTRINTPRRMASGRNRYSQRAVNGSNANSQTRQMPWINSPSPLSYSPQLNHGSNMRTQSYRESIAVAESPSRFAPTTNGSGQGPFWISPPGTSYMTASPSRAASDGTSAFRDARLPSPWRDARPPTPWRDARPPTPWRDARPPTPWRDARPPTPWRDARPPTPWRDARPPSPWT